MIRPSEVLETASVKVLVITMIAWQVISYLRTNELETWLGLGLTLLLMVAIGYLARKQFTNNLSYFIGGALAYGLSVAALIFAKLSEPTVLIKVGVEALVFGVLVIIIYWAYENY